MIRKPFVSAGAEQIWRGMVYVQCQCKGFQPMGNESSNFVYSIRPGSQSCAVAKSEEFWRTTGQSNLAGKRLAATTATRTAAFWPMEQSFILSQFSPFSYCAWFRQLVWPKTGAESMRGMDRVRTACTFRCLRYLSPIVGSSQLILCQR